MGLRESLIKEAERIFASLTDNELYTLTLTPPAAIYQRIIKLLTGALTRGQVQVVSELRAQGAAIATVSGVADESSITSLADLTVSRVTNEVQTRAINQVATFGILGAGTAEIRNLLGTELRGQSEKWVDSYAGAAVNAATMEGRGIEMEALKEEISVYEYSAILDMNTCDECGSWDGVQAPDVGELPDAPNPDCDGGDRCRCFIVAIYGEN